jgi:hypothetical protein
MPSGVNGVKLFSRAAAFAKAGGQIADSPQHKTVLPLLKRPGSCAMINYFEDCGLPESLSFVENHSRFFAGSRVWPMGDRDRLNHCAGQ